MLWTHSNSNVVASQRLMIPMMMSGRRTREKVTTVNSDLCSQLRLPMQLERRQFLQTMLAAIPAANLLADELPREQNETVIGMLYGSLIGDALGGALEFASDEMRAGRVANCRSWDENRRLDPSSIQELGESLHMWGYEEIRPQTAPYGPWIASAPAGTVTDDSRWKVVLIRAFRAAHRDGQRELTQQDIARAIVAFKPDANREPNEATARLIDEGLREYRYASQWVLGVRDPKIALPLDRLWAGAPNCSGQMMMLPLAACFAGQPENGYRRCFDLNFVDGPGANDITSAIVAGLANLLGETSTGDSVADRWRRMESTMRDTDPYRIRDVPFVGRPLNQWLDFADSIVRRADGRPKIAYRLLETEGKPIYYWDAHFTLLVAVVLLKLTGYDPLASLHLGIDFGHDTDSYTQLMGAMIGAVHGVAVFPDEMQIQVAERMEADFGENVSSWSEILSTAKFEDKL